MRNTAQASKIVRTAVVGVGLLAALAFGSVAADQRETGLTECDHGCKVEALAGKSGGNAQFQIVSVTTLDYSAYVSNGPGEIGFTE